MGPSSMPSVNATYKTYGPTNAEQSPTSGEDVPSSDAHEAGDPVSSSSGRQAALDAVRRDLADAAAKYRHRNRGPDRDHQSADELAEAAVLYRAAMDRNARITGTRP